MKKFWILFIFSALSLVACRKDDTTDNGETDLYYGNLFCASIMRSYYLWNEEMAEKINAWSSRTDPAKQVENCRYELDEWTCFYNNISTFQMAVDGVMQSMGFEFVVKYLNEEKTEIGAVVTFTYEGTSAREAGLKRGDVIVAIDGQKLMLTNYSNLLNRKIYQSNFIEVELQDGRNVTLDSKKMYLNPVHTVRTLDVEGKKIGYLHYTSFTQESCKELEKVFRQFREDGISELVLDLRYNGGGYAAVSTALASMIAPAEKVNGNSPFVKSIFNSVYTEYLEEHGTSMSTPFTPHPSILGEEIDAIGVNPGIQKLWVITGSMTASAAEELICGLEPYMDVTLVGRTTSGKFCGGNIITAADWYQSVGEGDNASKINWRSGLRLCANNGIYVMISRYTDCNGVTLSMPDGIDPDIPVSDDPLEAIPLGDPNERMLAAVLAQTKAPGSTPADDELPFEKPGFGLLIY